MLRNGIRAFTVNNEQSLKSLLNKIDAFGKSSTKPFFILLSDNINPARLKLITATIEDKVFNTDSLPLPTEKELSEKEKKYVFLVPQTKNTKKSDPLCYTLVRLSSEISYPTAPFLLCDSQETVSLPFRLLRFWNTHAQPINFIRVSPEAVSTLQKDLEKLNELNRISGMFVYQGKAISGVNIEENKITLSNAHFCLPYDYFVTLTPQKDGYFFSPAYITSNYSMVYKYFRIHVYRQQSAYLRLLKMDFNRPDSLHSVYNFINQDIIIKTENNVKSANFNGSTSQISFTPEFQTDSLLDFSTIFRFKITSKERFQAIVSQGKQFCFKVSDGHPSFNVYVNKPYIATECKLDTGVWYNMAFVLSRGNKLALYMEGKKFAIFKIDSLKPTREIMQIGNNSQFEPFKGEISEISMWNRVLSQEEIEEALKTHTIKESKPLAVWILLPLLMLLVLGTVYLFRKNKKDAPIKQEKTIKCQIKNSMFLFGDFKLLNRNGEDIAAEMSPKLRHLLILVTVETIRNGKGITTKALTEELWPGMSDEAAKNSRSPYVSKLRNLLSTTDGLHFLFRERCWRIAFSNDFHTDFFFFFTLLTKLQEQVKSTSPEVSTDDVKELCRLVSGNILQHEEHEYIDMLRTAITEDIINLADALSSHSSLGNDVDLLLKMADMIYKLDELSEEALSIQVKAYRLQNNLKLQKVAVSNFARKYQKIYNANFDSSKYQ